MNPTEQRRMGYFQLLTVDEQRAAIRKIASSGLGDYTIASATAISVEMVRAIIGKRGLETELKQQRPAAANS